ncbi:MAG: RNA-binding protein [Patescibacteria group bacterium]
MAKKLFIGNLNYDTTSDGLRDAFAQFGAITDATVIIDRMSGRSKGFGFVEFEDDSAADAAISSMNGSELEGRELIVNEARPMEPRAPRRDFNR